MEQIAVMELCEEEDDERLTKFKLSQRPSTCLRYQDQKETYPNSSVTN